MQNLPPPLVELLFYFLSVYTKILYIFIRYMILCIELISISGSIKSFIKFS